MNESAHPGDLPQCWPALPLGAWRKTCATLHMWTQIVGKIRLAQVPRINHWWNVPLYVHARGLTTATMPYRDRAFEIRFDFIGHLLVLETSAGQVETMPLAPCSVASFHRRLVDLLRSADIDVPIWTMPVEVPDPIRFEDDNVHASYDRSSVERFWRILVSVDRVFNEFRSGFTGKCSPVHFFWGSFDLAVTRFSGRRAPERPGADAITREAYSHEVSSVGFWPGGGEVADAAFYSYTSPEPAGFREFPVLPAQAAYHRGLGEYLLMYDDVRAARSPSAALLEFCRTTYAAGADCGHWDRGALERPAVAVARTVA